MSVSRPARCLFNAPSIPVLRPRMQCRKFHCTPSVSIRRRPKTASVKAEDMGLVDSMPARELFKRYSEEELKELKEKYTPGQLEAIAAGEDTIDPEDLKRATLRRSTMGEPEHLDSFAMTTPGVDTVYMHDQPYEREPLSFGSGVEKTVDKRIQYISDVTNEFLYQEIDEKDPDAESKVRPNRIDGMKLLDIDTSLKDVHQRPGVPYNIFSEESEEKQTLKAKQRKIKKDAEEEADPRDPEGIYDVLIKKTGLTLDDIFNLKVKILVRHRVVNQTRLGKIASIYCLAIAGNGNGRLGMGEAKGIETEETMNMAKIAAIKAMLPIPRYEERTIFGDVYGKVSATEVKVMARPPGFGLRCQSLIFEMARAAGLHDLSAKVPRSRNKMNTVKATYQALMKQRLPEDIAQGLGKKLVDVRKVYYGGQV